MIHRITLLWLLLALQGALAVNTLNQLDSDYGVANVKGIPVQYFLTSTGDNSINRNLNGNYSAAAVDFYWQATTRYDLHSLLVAISDNANFNQVDYGGIPNGTVVNGVTFWIQPFGAAKVPLLSGYIVTHNYDWLSMTAFHDLTQFAGLSQTLVANFSTIDSYGKPLILNVGDRIGITLHDDFSTLVAHTFGIRGIAHP